MNRAPDPSPSNITPTHPSMNLSSLKTALLLLGACLSVTSCQQGTSSRTAPEKPLVDQQVRLNGTFTKARFQIIPRKVTHIGGAQPAVSGTFDLVVEAKPGLVHRVDLGTLIGKGGSNKLTFIDKKGVLVFQDLNHDGTLDTNVFHGGDGYALVSFGKNGTPLRLKFDGDPFGGYAKPKGTSALDLISTNGFTLIPRGFRWFEQSSRIDALWNRATQVFELDI